MHTNLESRERGRNKDLGDDVITESKMSLTVLATVEPSFQTDQE